MKTATPKLQSESTHLWSTKSRNESFFSTNQGKRNSFFGPAAIQPKLKIGEPDNQYEKQADRVADAVIKMPENAQPIQRQMLDQEEEESVQAKEMEEEEELQMKSDKSAKSGNNVSDTISYQIQSTSGSGRKLPHKIQSEMSRKIGSEFKGVNIHTDSEAAEMNQSLGARAFTHGRDIYFNSGEYRPQSTEGKRLLAHELTHVVQQRNSRIHSKIQRTIDDGHDLSSPRFSGNEKLESAYDIGEPNIVKWQQGMHIRVIQQALIDSGHDLPDHGVDGIFGPETETAIENFQSSSGFTGSDITGIIDEQTMTELDQYFQDHSPMADIARSSPPGSETRNLTPEEVAEIERLRTSEVTAPSGGPLPTFNPDKNGPDSYENEVKARVLHLINIYHNEAAANETARANPNNIHDWSFIEDIADQAKQKTDQVYGSYYSPGAMPAFRHGVNLFDARDDKESQYTTGGAAYENRRVNWRVQKIIQGSHIRPIDEDHGAVQSRPDENNILNRVKSQVVSAKRSELILIDKWWPGYADPSTSSVFLQRMKASTNSGNRDFAWDIFQTMIHEYIHTLEHPDSRTYRQSLPETRGGKTYREGMTEYFTKIVLEDITYDASLRNSVEGPYHNPAITHTIPRYHGYAEAENAEAVVGLVGIRNALSSFFDGEVHLIGGPGP